MAAINNTVHIKIMSNVFQYLDHLWKGCMKLACILHLNGVHVWGKVLRTLALSISNFDIKMLTNYHVHQYLVISFHAVF